MTEPPRPTLCPAHPAARAAWLCGPCKKALCEDCAAPLAAGRGILPVCAACGTLATPLLIPRAHARSSGDEVRGAVGAVLRPGALALIAVMTCATGFLASFEGSFWTLAQVLSWSWALTCCGRAAHGYPPFGIPTYSDLAETLSSILPRLAVSAGFLGLAGAVLVDWGHRPTPSLLESAGLGGLTVWLVPPALVAAILVGPGAGWVAPWAVPRFSARVPFGLGPLRLAAAALALAAVASATTEPFKVVEGGGDTHLDAHILQMIALRFAIGVALSMLAVLAGRLVFLHAEELGHGDPDSHRVPALPEAAPRGRRARG